MILGRMVINMMIDTVLGAIPVAGDVFDFVWKANKRNAALLDKYQQQPQQVYRKSLIENIIFIAVLLSILVLMIALIGWIIGLIATAISS